MKRLSTMVLAAAGLAAVLASPAAADGIFRNFPIVSGASYCDSYATGSSGQVCASTVPAGPTGLTGNEYVGADTALAQGRNPQTVKIPSRLLGGGAIAFEAPLTGVTYTVSASTGKLLIKPAGTIAAHTIVLPAAADLLDGQTLEVTSTQTITALTVTAGSGTTVNNSPTALTPSTTAQMGYKFIYRAADTSWYRLQ